MPILEQDMEALDRIYVRKEDCGDIQTDFKVRLEKGSGEFALINKELVWIKWLLLASVGERLLSFISGNLLPFLR